MTLPQTSQNCPELSQTGPTKPNPLQVEKIGPNPTQPDNNCHWLTLSLYYSFWVNSTRPQLWDLVVDCGEGGISPPHSPPPSTHWASPCPVRYFEHDHLARLQNLGWFRGVVTALKPVRAEQVSRPEWKQNWTVPHCGSVLPICLSLIGL